MKIDASHNTVEQLLLKISIHGPCVLNGCVVRRKSDFAQVAKLRRSTILSLVGSGLIEIDKGHIRLTRKGQYQINKGTQKSHSANYTQRMKDRGCVRKQVWVHPDDIERFEDFLRTLKGPMDD